MKSMETDTVSTGQFIFIFPFPSVMRDERR